MVQSALQPSAPAWLPSSQISLGSSAPLPHLPQGCPGTGQIQPVSGRSWRCNVSARRAHLPHGALAVGRQAKPLLVPPEHLPRRRRPRWFLDAVTAAVDGAPGVAHVNGPPSVVKVELQPSRSANCVVTLLATSTTPLPQRVTATAAGRALEAWLLQMTIRAAAVAK